MTVAHNYIHIQCVVLHIFQTCCRNYSHVKMFYRKIIFTFHFALSLSPFIESAFCGKYLLRILPKWLYTLVGKKAYLSGDMYMHICVCLLMLQTKTHLNEFFMRLFMMAREYSVVAFNTILN